MENAVPIVTQAPGAQPLQIQPGLLAQVILYYSCVAIITLLFTKRCVSTDFLPGGESDAWAVSQMLRVTGISQ